MKLSKVIAIFSLLIATLPAHGLTIFGNLIAAGESLGSFGTAGNAPSNAAGGGTLQGVFNSAASYWESLINDDHTLVLDYGWIARDSYAGHRQVLADASPYHREIYGLLAFDNDESTVWFADSTPNLQEEYISFLEEDRDLGSGTPISVGYVFGNAQGDAAGRIDLWTSMVHEIGHALGLSSANIALFIDTFSDHDVDIVGYGPAYDGSEIPIQSSSAHIDIANALMYNTRPAGVRRLASQADLLTIAQLSHFTDIDLDQGPTVPEPTTTGLFLGIASLSILWLRHRHS